MIVRPAAQTDDVGYRHSSSGWASAQSANAHCISFHFRLGTGDRGATRRLLRMLKSDGGPCGWDVTVLTANGNLNIRYFDNTGTLIGATTYTVTDGVTAGIQEGVIYHALMVGSGGSPYTLRVIVTREDGVVVCDSTSSNISTVFAAVQGIRVGEAPSPNAFNTVTGDGFITTPVLRSHAADGNDAAALAALKHPYGAMWLSAGNFNGLAGCLYGPGALLHDGLAGDVIAGSNLSLFDRPRATNFETRYATEVTVGGSPTFGDFEAILDDGGVDPFFVRRGVTPSAGTPREAVNAPWYRLLNGDLGGPLIECGLGNSRDTRKSRDTRLTLPSGQSYTDGLFHCWSEDDLFPFVGSGTVLGSTGAASGVFDWVNGVYTAGSVQRPSTTASVTNWDNWCRLGFGDPATNKPGGGAPVILTGSTQAVAWLAKLIGRSDYEVGDDVLACVIIAHVPGGGTCRIRHAVAENSGGLNIGLGSSFEDHDTDTAVDSATIGTWLGASGVKIPMAGVTVPPQVGDFATVPTGTGVGMLSQISAISDDGTDYTLTFQRAMPDVGDAGDTIAWGPVYFDVHAHVITAAELAALGGAADHWGEHVLWLSGGPVGVFFGCVAADKHGLCPCAMGCSGKGYATLDSEQFTLAQPRRANRDARQEWFRALHTTFGQRLNVRLGDATQNSSGVAHQQAWAESVVAAGVPASQIVMFWGGPLADAATGEITTQARNWSDGLAAAAEAVGCVAVSAISVADVGHPFDVFAQGLHANSLAHWNANGNHRIMRAIVEQLQTAALAPPAVGLSAGTPQNAAPLMVMGVL